MDEDHACFIGYLMGGDSVRRRQTGGALRDHRCSVASLVDEFLAHELGRRPSCQEVDDVAERVRALKPRGGKEREAAVRAECRRYLRESR